MKNRHECRSKDCNKVFGTYEGRLYHERKHHLDLQRGGYNCGKLEHNHPSREAAKKCVYRRKKKMRLGQSQGQSQVGQSQGHPQVVHSQGNSQGHSQGQSQGQSQGLSQGQSQGHSQGKFNEKP